MADYSKIHWAAPTTIVASLTLGVLFALAHHIFYQSLAGTSTPNNEYDFYVTEVSPQQLDIAVGTSFAFLVNAKLVMAISTAYVQLFWRSMVYRAKDVTLDALDCVSSALSNIYALCKIKVWYRHPLLFAIVCVCW